MNEWIHYKPHHKTYPVSFLSHHFDTNLILGESILILISHIKERIMMI